VSLRNRISASFAFQTDNFYFTKIPQQIKREKRASVRQTMLSGVTLTLALLSISHATSAVRTPKQHIVKDTLTVHQVKRPSVPSANPLHSGLQTGTLDCNATAAPIEKVVANNTLHRFCSDHLGVNIAHGDNYSTWYDTVNDTRLYFNVINECAPNGVYLPFETCVSGFTRVAQCTADCGFKWTAGGETIMDCIAFGLNAVTGVAPVVPVVGNQGDGVVVTCEGLC
jgi:hypothetical protein